MAWVHRTELPVCQVGVGYPDAECGSPAVAYWQFKDGVLYVCEEHDCEVDTAECAMMEGAEGTASIQEVQDAMGT